MVSFQSEFPKRWRDFIYKASISIEIFRSKWLSQPLGDFHGFFAVKKYVFLEFHRRIVLSMVQVIHSSGVEKIGTRGTVVMLQLVGGCNPANPAIQNISWNSSSIFCQAPDWETSLSMTFNISHWLADVRSCDMLSSTRLLRRRDAALQIDAKKQHQP